MAGALTVAVARAYDRPRGMSGTAVLVDRLWPRGVAKADAWWEQWRKDVAPSPELRTWYGHEPDRFEEFAARYHDELGRVPASAAVKDLRTLARGRGVVLVTATRDVERSGARVLADHLRGRRTAAPSQTSRPRR